MMKSYVVATTALGFMLTLWCGSARADGRAALGVTLDDSLPGQARITSIYSGSPASQAGLMAGDRVVSINGKQVSQWQDVTDAVGKSVPGAKLEMEVDRLGWRGHVNVTLGQAQTVFSAPPTARIVPPLFHPVRPASTFSLQPAYTPADIDDQHGYGS